MIHLVTGGARSGKSTFAEQWLQAQAVTHGSLPVYYLATATAGDEEMAQRIARHQADRPAHWQTVEVPLDLAEPLKALPAGLVLIDCMTLWLSNWLERDEPGWLSAKNAFLETLERTVHCQVVIVSNEVGSGVVPLGALSRRFVDEAGWLNQALARRADQVTLVVAGCPLVLKSGSCSGRPET